MSGQEQFFWSEDNTKVSLHVPHNYNVEHSAQLVILHWGEHTFKFNENESSHDVHTVGYVHVAQLLTSQCSFVSHSFPVAFHPNVQRAHSLVISQNKQLYTSHVSVVISGVYCTHCR